MSVLIELRELRSDVLNATRVKMNRVPIRNEVIRLLRAPNGLTTAFHYKVTTITHNANTDEYPKRDGDIDAWVDCYMIMDGSR